MTREDVFVHVLSCFGTQPDYPWSDDNAVLRRADNRKWYAIIMAVGRDRLGLSGEGTVDVINVKCDPLLISSLRAQEGFHPAYHMNKDKWITARLDGSVPAEPIAALLEISYSMTETGKRKKK